MSDKRQEIVAFIEACKQLLEVAHYGAADWASAESDDVFQQMTDDTLYNCIRNEPFEFRMKGTSSDGHRFMLEFRLIDMERDK